MKIELKEKCFSAVHFIVEHKKCERLHGHNWCVRVVVEGELDERGMVVDFIELRQILEEICMKYDHRVLLPENSPVVKCSVKGRSVRVRAGGREFEFPRSDVVWLPVVNVTVEELARLIAGELAVKLRHPNLRKLVVFVSEAPGQSAVFEHEF